MTYHAANKLCQLGAERDRTPVPTRPPTPWAEGDEPHGESVDLNEYAVELLKLRKCRSFRADLFHKLTIIMRARGGYGRRGLHNAAVALRVSRQTLHRWLGWQTSPRSVQMFSRIDNLYVDALEKLVAEKSKKK